MYSPDPYVTVQALGTPNGVKRTQHVKDSSDPEWGETLQFFVDPEKDRILGERSISFGFYRFFLPPQCLNIHMFIFELFLLAEFVLYDQNRTVNEEIGREIHDFYGLIPDEEHNVVVCYKNVSS